MLFLFIISFIIYVVGCVFLYIELRKIWNKTLLNIFIIIFIYSSFIIVYFMYRYHTYKQISNDYYTEVLDEHLSAKSGNKEYLSNITIGLTTQENIFQLIIVSKDANVSCSSFIAKNDLLSLSNQVSELLKNK